jgi:hypothetical protein
MRRNRSGVKGPRPLRGCLLRPGFGGFCRTSFRSQMGCVLSCRGWPLLIKMKSFGMLRNQRVRASCVWSTEGKACVKSRYMMRMSL